jgi:ATP-dependent helicase/nuclease subunit A
MTITYKSASAGSGKTYSIEHTLCAKLIAHEIIPSQVLAVTFTRKAANELKNRIVGNLLKQGETLLAADMMNARMGTVNSVFGELLNEAAFELGLAPNTVIIEDSDKSALLAEAIDTSISESETKRLNELAGRLKIESWHIDLLKIIEQMRVNNLEPTELKNFAAQSVRSLLSALPSVDPSFNEETFINLLRQFVRDAKAVEKPTKGLTTSISAVEGMLGQRQLNWQNWIQISKIKPTKCGESAFASVREFSGNVLQVAEFQNEMQEFIELLMLAAERTMSAFASIKASRGLVDFIDQEQLTLKAIKLPSVAARLKSQVRYLIVDEFQDTSPLQLALFAALSELVDDILLVGDPKQAIYGFRGSDPKLALDVLEYVKTQGGQIDSLEYSWRSRPGLVHLTNELFTTPFSHLLSPDQIQLKPKLTNKLDSPELEWWKLEGSRADLRQSALAAGVLEHFNSKTKIWDDTIKDSREIQWQDIAILCRSNDEAAQAAEKFAAIGIPVVLERAGLVETTEISLALACMRRLIDPNDSLASAEILSLALGQNASAWLEDRLQAVTDDNTREWNRSAHPILEKLDAARTDIQVLSPKEALLLAMQAADIQQIIVGWDESNKLTDHRLANLARLCDLVADYESRCKANHLAGTTTGFVLWLRDIEQNFTDAQAPNPGDAVNILTYHKSKGLEWPVVICSGLNAALKFSLFGTRVISKAAAFNWQDPLAARKISYWPYPFPDQKGSDPITSRLIGTKDWIDAERQAKNEQIQLLYVGMTRARDQLILTESGKNTVGDWLTVLESPIFPADSGELALSDGSSLNFVSKSYSSPEPDDTPDVKVARDRYWLLPTKDAAVKSENYSCPASSQSQLDSASANIIYQSYKRIVLNGTPDMSKVGDVVHHCLALLLTNPNVDSDVLAEIVTNNIPGILDASDIKQSSQALADWINTEYPGAKLHTELPYSLMLANGQSQTGQIDLVLELENGWVIIDHKSNPQPTSKWCEISLEHSGQLAAYANALSQLSDKPVLKTLIHFSVSGGLVELSC